MRDECTMAGLFQQQKIPPPPPGPAKAKLGDESPVKPMSFTVHLSVSCVTISSVPRSHMKHRCRNCCHSVVIEAPFLTHNGRVSCGASQIDMGAQRGRRHDAHRSFCFAILAILPDY